MLAAWSPAGVCIAAAALAGAAAAGWWAFEQGRAAKRPGPAGGEAGRYPPGAQRPRPTLEPWVVVVAALAIAALVIAPRLLGFTFLVFPFVFGRRRPRRPPGPERWEAGPDDLGHDRED